MKTILIVFGTRPEAIKLAPVIRKLRERPHDASVSLCSTGQHREMLDDTMAALDLKPDIDLQAMQAGQHPTELLGRLLIGLRATIEEVKPDIVVVQGDTMTVTAAALAGYLGHAKIAHVEAGLRTRDKRSPFPEEINRRVTTAIADYHFAPTAHARDALLAEGIPAHTIFVTGNTVVDTLRWARDHITGDLPGHIRLDAGKRLILVTAHRRESFGEPFRHLCEALRDIAEKFEDVQLVYPVHLNPNVRQPVNEILGQHPNIQLIEPLGYRTFVQLRTAAHLVLTDSGGIQEEAPALGKPVLVLREKTERPEGVTAGVVKLVGTDRHKIVNETSRLLTDRAAYAAMSREVNVYGDGMAAQRVAEVLLDNKMSTPEFQLKS